jgi:hypothetical protein
MTDTQAGTNIKTILDWQRILFTDIDGFLKLVENQEGKKFYPG